MALSASDLPAMYSLLTNSLSGEQSVRKPAETALAQSENRSGFCSCLMEVITAKDLVSQVDVRLMASVYFKNSINRYWRNKRDSTGISNEEKLHLRQKLLSHLREENYQIALTLSVIISKIARIDYPKEWPELFSFLAQQLQSADILTSHRIFMILYRTLKELSTKRLTSDQRTFAEICTQFFDYSWHLWQTDMQTILHGFSTLAQTFGGSAAELHHDDLYLTCERWFLCSKIIRQLIISGFPSDAKTLQCHLEKIHRCYFRVILFKDLKDSSFRDHQPKFWDLLKRACTKLMKILVAIQQRHPYSFGDKCVLPLVMEFCLSKILDPEPQIMSSEQFMIQCMVMVKTILEGKEYKTNMTGRVVDENRVTFEQMKQNISSTVAGLLTSLLPTDRVVLLCNVLIRRYFVLTASDMEEWYQNPESFYHEQDSVLWSEKLRPCAEALYIVLFENHSQLLGPVVVSILREAMSGCPSAVNEITPELLLKDAAYGAAAYIYYELSNYLSFKDWFNGALSLELTNDHPNMRIIHRKVALILGQWVSEIKDDTRRAVYCALIRLLQDNDLCVRLTACRSLYFHIEDANFNENEFLDLLPVCWDLCFKVVDEVQEFDSKVQVLNTISVLIARVTEVTPYANKLMLFFQKAWEESSGESILQIQLLTALKNFVVALGYQSPKSYGMLLPILQSGINVTSPDELLEDCMQLWEATLINAPSMVPELLGYFPCLVEILERSFDHLKVATNIIEDYVILGGREFLSLHESSVAKLLDLVVGNVNDRGLLSVIPVIDILIQCFPMEVPQLISSTLQKLIIACLTGGDDHDPSKAAVKASSSALLARILVMNTNYLAQLTSDPSLSMHLQKSGFPGEENILLCLVDIWLEKVDNVTSFQRKTIGLALSIILTLRLPQVLDKLDQIMSDSVCTSKPHVPSKELRRRQMKLSDPINQISLENSVRDNLQTCSALHGESFNAAIGRLHPAVLNQLKQALKMP
ncbi:hypothetical protein HAX54_031577 [Datura stramonium]|uniref:Importin N-terminal domain-containing protein n=1 Tax=Datura stramonium TaxID=4076 RepID=A0ABS8RLI8_DATST|nr:hypothetical protein [Datura stramonium]